MLFLRIDQITDMFIFDLPYSILRHFNFHIVVIIFGRNNFFFYFDGFPFIISSFSEIAVLCSSGSDNERLTIEKIIKPISDKTQKAHLMPAES